MRTIDIGKATGSLAHYARRTRKGPMILTSKGRPVAALVSMNSLDLESFSLSTNPEFIAIIERSRARHHTEGGISSAEMRRRLGIKKTA
jgi:prevent-host-death family protein